eukprot:SM000095S25001  [mRNA]  locus=s95:457384:463183:+ [translate_table: standard]
MSPLAGSLDSRDLSFAKMGPGVPDSHGSSQPLPSFICPITREVMEDPVQIASGQMYERAAIEQWFAQGQERCPMGQELANTTMRPNLNLRSSIAEWRERNYRKQMDTASKLLTDSGSLQDQLDGLKSIRDLCLASSSNKYSTVSRGLLPPLIALLRASDTDLRIAALRTVLAVVLDNIDNKEAVAEAGAIDAVVRSLGKKAEEGHCAVMLLQELSTVPIIADCIARSQGAVLLLVTMLGSESEEAASCARAVLMNLPSNDELIQSMAGANLFTPLVVRLRDGPTTSKVTIAQTLAKLQMTDKSKLFIAKEGAIEPLLSLLHPSFPPEHKQAAVCSLQALSSVESIARAIGKAPGVWPTLTALLSNIRLSPIAKAAVADMLAHILTATGRKWTKTRESQRELEDNLLSLLPLLGPGVSNEVQALLLKGLAGSAEGLITGTVARPLLKEHALQPLLSFLREDADPTVRRQALHLIYCLSPDFQEYEIRALQSSQPAFSYLVSLFKAPGDQRPEERLAAAWILANAPAEDEATTKLLQSSGVISVLALLLQAKVGALQEAVAGVLERFTLPRAVDLQRQVAAQGVIPVLVRMLDRGTPLGKRRAVAMLANFSTNTPSLSKPVKHRRLGCFGTPEEACILHSGICSVQRSMCLVQAQAIKPLVLVLREAKSAAAEEAVRALHTLVQEERMVQKGLRLIAEARGIQPVIELLTNGTPQSQERAVVLCEIIFREEEYKKKYGMAAQMHVITVAQHGAPKVKQVAGRILRQLELLDSQSDYFGGFAGNPNAGPRGAA